MRTVLRSILVFALVLSISSLVMAQRKGNKKQRRGNRGPAAAAFQLPNSIQLNEDQQAKIAKLKKEYRPKLAALQQKVGEIITPEVRRARRKATEEARAAGKRGRELRQAVAAAGNLSDEQQKQLSALQRERRKLNQEIRQQILAFLTDEQKAELKKNENRRRPQNRKKKKNAPKKDQA